MITRCADTERVPPARGVTVSAAALPAGLRTVRTETADACVGDRTVLRKADVGSDPMPDFLFQDIENTAKALDLFVKKRYNNAKPA